MGTLVCKCGKALNYEARHAGKKVRCAGCSKVLVVPEEVEEIEEVEEVEEVRPARRRPRRDEDEEEQPRKAKRPTRGEDEDDDRPRRRRRDEDEDDEDEDDRPRKRKKTAEPNAFAAMLTSVPGRWALVIVGILGIVGVVMGWREGALASNSSATPQTITINDLLAKGPGNNLHVVLTGFVPGTNYVTLSRNNFVESIYVPLLPAGAAGGQTRLILMSRNAKDPTSLQAKMSGGRVQGLLVNSVQGIDSKVSDLLRQSYPGVDMNTVYILEEGRAPMSRGIALALMIGGAVLAVVAVGLGLFALVYGGVLE